MKTKTLWDNKDGFFYSKKDLHDGEKKIFRIKRELHLDELGANGARGYLLNNGRKLIRSRQYAPASPWYLI